MASHLLVLIVFSTLVSVVFAMLLREDRKARVRFALMTFGAFVLSAVVVGWLMYPFHSLGVTALRVAVVPGDGIGVEVIAEAVKALRAVATAAGRSIRTTDFDWGAEKYLATGVTLPPGALEMLQGEFDAILLGAMGDPRL